MMRFFIVMLILGLACFAIYHFCDKEMLEMFLCKPSAPNTSTCSAPVVTTGGTHNRGRTEKEKGINVTQKVDEWRKMLAEMRTVLNNIKEMQEESLKGKQ